MLDPQRKVMCECEEHASCVVSSTKQHEEAANHEDRMRQFTLALLRSGEAKRRAADGLSLLLDAAIIRNHLAVAGP